MINSPLTGADLCSIAIANCGIRVVFCITGAGNLALVDAIQRLGQTRIIYSHHEQAAVMEAQGYSRITGDIGCAIVTTGGGASNAMTGLLSAHLDSVPVLVISGNESSFHCKQMDSFRAFGVQGFDAVKVSSPITKTSIRISAVDEISEVLGNALAEAMTGRRGPVLVDFPMDIQRMSAQASYEESHQMAVTATSSDQLVAFSKECVDALSKAQKPILYFGNGIRERAVVESARSLAEEYGIPFFLSWSAIDLFEDNHPLNIGRVGLYGDRAGNIILQQADFILCIGTRLAIPQIGYDREDFGRCATKWVVDIDPVELSKFDGPKWNTCNSSAQDFISIFSGLLSEGNGVESSAFSRWRERIQMVWSQLPREDQVGALPNNLDQVVHSSTVISYLNNILPSDATVVTDVGAGLLSGHYTVRIQEGQRFFTSQGLGEMGFGLPGAIGAYFADESRLLVCLNTDGGIMFNLQELQVIAHHKIPIKLFIFNNDGYGMIRISQDNLFGSRYHGSDTASGVSCPNFGHVATTFGLTHVEIANTEDFESKLRPAIFSSEPCLIEVKMSPTQRYLPRLSTSKLEDGTLVSPPLEDLDPLIEIELLEELLGYRALPDSYAARGLTDDRG
jgi:acetolactate synthase-1/2/3 large subunit